ncbi:MAG TPA: amino acid adenylation domain-containing protein, partial [Thermoanaerobaculia bacterium]
ELRFDAGALPEQEAEHFARRFETLLGDALARPQTEIGALCALGEAERLRELSACNQTEVLWPDVRPVHRRVEEWARRQPAAAALISEAGTLTYDELNGQANRLAHHLRSLGVGPETRVGVRLERSREMVVAVLAVLKAGGAFVPLDPEYPEQRLARMYASSGAAVLVTRSRLDEDAAAIAACPAEDPDGGPSPGNLAYVIYTSGSTGAPKGVCVSHASLANYLSWLDASYPLAPADRLLLKAAFSFDVAVRELLWPLAAGAALVIAAPGGQRDAAYLAELIARHGVTVANFVPSMLASFLEQPNLAACSGLRRVLSGGEALPARLRDGFFARLESATLHNHYGPTEATITSTWWTCERGDERRFVPIGRPLANVRALVLDRFLEPVPAGVPGALAVGGAGLARGYLGDSAATAQAFVPDPHAGAPGERLYLSGDLARRLPDGSLEFLGRGDDQVKVRGFRIEPGEIEHVLGESPEVAAVAVALRGDAAAEPCLVAYVVPAEPRAGVAIPGLREWLRSRLPEHMVPAAFVVLDALPLSPSGKLDRRALPVPDPSRPEAGHRHVEPRDPVEEVVADVWAEVLKLERVGAEDDFFALGGHSLLAMQVVSRLQETFRAPLPLRVLFEENTVEKLSRALVAAEPRPGQTEKIARVLRKVRELSAEGVRAELAERRAPGEGMP